MRMYRLPLLALALPLLDAADIGQSATRQYNIEIVAVDPAGQGDVATPRRRTRAVGKREASEREFYAALCAIALGALALLFVAVGVIPSFGLFATDRVRGAGNTRRQTQGNGTRVAVFRHLSRPPPLTRSDRRTRLALTRAVSLSPSSSSLEGLPDLRRRDLGLEVRAQGRMDALRVRLATRLPEARPSAFRSKLDFGS
jgi:hypothetical protein